MTSSPSLFVQRLESSQFAPQTRVNSSQFTYRLESSRVSLHTDSNRDSTSLESIRPTKLLNILTCGNFHIQFYYEAMARHLIRSNIK